METLAAEPEITRASLDQAIANAALEGLLPDPETLADLKLMANRKLIGNDYRNRIKSRYGKL